jgi:hypothetical protein
MPLDVRWWLCPAGKSAIDSGAMPLVVRASPESWYLEIQGIALKRW